MRTRIITLLLASQGLLAAPATAPTSAALTYPAVPRGDVVDDYHGTEVPDPYRALEALDSPATQQFVAAQNALSKPWLEALPQREWIKNRLTKVWNYPHLGLPVKKGGKYFFLRSDGTQNQSVLHVADAPGDVGRVLLDPNNVRGDATVSLARFVPSPDGTIVAYSLSDGGSDWEIWRFRRVADGKDLPDELRYSKFWELCWAHDGSGVYYSRYRHSSSPARADKGDDQSQPAVYFHNLGSSQLGDQRIYRVRGSRSRAPSAGITDDGRYLVVTLFDGYEVNGVDLIDLRRKKERAVPLFAAWDAQYSVIGSTGDTFFVSTTQGAPRGRIIAVDVRTPRPEQWRTVVPESQFAIQRAHFIGGRIVVNYVVDAHSVLKLYDTNGAPVGDAPLPGLGTVGDVSGQGDDPEAFFTYTDYMRPLQVERLDVSTNKTSVTQQATLAADTSPYVTEQVFYASRDGTRIPMFITRRRDAPRDGRQPTLLYGYGGFNVSATPGFRPQILVWLDMGGIFAEANLRGGGEYGEAWHQAGTRANKQNVFDDFIAAAEYLVREKWTQPQRLAIQGRSNGGLLIGAVLTQRPELFGAALPIVGVHDILRYQTASANARQWSTDFGLSENAADFAAQIRYSPVHNTRKGVCYPPTLITTADHDDRVVPWHSYKFAAALQHDQACANPVLIRIETRAGHGAGKPVWMQIDDFADQWAFAAQALGMTVPPLTSPTSAAPSTPPTTAPALPQTH